MSDSDTTVRVVLRYPDLDTFVEKFAANVTRGGVFLPTADLRPVGSALRFELALPSGRVVLAGQGKVVWQRQPDPAAPMRPHGLGLQFLSVEPATRPVLERLLDRRVANGRQPTPAGGVGPVRPAPASTEFDKVEDSSLRRMVDRARLLSTRTDDLEALLRPEADDGTTIAQAVAELPRYLSVVERRTSGSALMRLPGVTPPAVDEAGARKDGPKDDE